MDKTTLFRIFAILVVAGFIFELFAFGVIGKTSEQTNGQNTQESATYSGYSEYYGTIKAYEPYLFAKGLDSGQISEIKALGGVEDVVAMSGGYVISLKNSDYINAVYSGVLDRMINSTVIANVALPYSIEILAQDGKNKSAASNGAIVKVEMSSPPNVGEKIRLKMTVEIQEGILARYSTPTLVPEEKMLAGNGIILSETSVTTIALVPWEERNNVNVDALKEQIGNDSVAYLAKNYIGFADENSANAAIGKNLSYVVSLNTGTATINENFTDKAQVIADLGEGIVFPDSVLQVKGTDGADFPKIFKKMTYYTYLVNSTAAGSDTLDAISETKHTSGDEVNLSVKVLAVGNKIVNLVEAKIN